MTVIAEWLLVKVKRGRVRFLQEVVALAIIEETEEMVTLARDEALTNKALHSSTTREIDQLSLRAITREYGYKAVIEETRRG